MLMTTKAKVLLGLVCVAILLGVMSNLFTYERKGTVVESNGCEVVVLDRLGYEWEVKAEGLKVGDEVVMTMVERGATTIIDDEVVDITKREK